MLKLPLIFILVLLNGVFTCKWVCIDKYNNIKRQYIDTKKFNLDYQKHVITVPALSSNNVKKGKKMNTIPEVILRSPEFLVEPQGISASCESKEFTKTIKNMNNKIKCKPRETIVDIKYNGGRVTPNKISTKLCTGVCGSTKTCLSVERKNISLAVSVTDATSKPQCSTVMVPEDTKCKCGCDKTASDCLPTQVFDKKFCKCKCVNEDEQRNCINKINNHYNKYMWNKNACTCQCLHESICTTGTEWNKNDCKCLRKR